MRTGRSTVLIILPWLSLAAALVVDAVFWRVLPFGDFHVYYVAGQSVLQGADLYGLDPAGGLSTTLRFTYPPFAALCLAGLALLPFAAAGQVFVVLSLVALVVTCVLIARQLPVLAGRELMWSTRELTALMLALAALLHPVVNTVSNGQIGLFLLLMIVADFMLVGKHRGVLTGLATGIKLTPGLFVVLFAAARRWREFWLACAAFAASVGLGWLVLPEASRDYWLGLLFDRERVGDAADPENTSLLGLFSRLLPGQAEPLWLVTSVIVLAVVIWQGAKWYRVCPPVAMALVALASLLVSPMSWSHHWYWALLMVPLLVVFVIRARARRRRGLLALNGVALVGFLMVAITGPDSTAQWLLWHGFSPADAGTSAWIGYQLLTAAYPVVGLVLLAAFAGSRSLFTGTAQSAPEAESPDRNRPMAREGTCVIPACPDPCLLGRWE